ncbi:MAG: TIGR01777 family oxidoreductase [Balneolaceae bacterium]|nr:TIGR01777 family oxidoreductase [Balneolaceae bacterium]
MKIVISGGTGFIGTRLTDQLLKEGHLVTIVTRTPATYEKEMARNQQFVSWEPQELHAAVDGSDVVINLAGESIFGQRWTEEIKERIRSSRLETTSSLVEAIAAAGEPPSLMVSVSGVDYYADGGEKVLDESAPPGDSFLSQVTQEWEAEARKVTATGTRLAIPRLGIVLEKGGGALQQMLPPFRYFVGGPVGSGHQYFPWIHMHDLCRGLLYPATDPDFEGPYNLSSPEPVTMREFASVLGEVIRRPSLFRVPEFALRLALGEAAEPILGSHRVKPQKLQQAGFRFHYESLREALADIL